MSNLDNYKEFLNYKYNKLNKNLYKCIKISNKCDQHGGNITKQDVDNEFMLIDKALRNIIKEISILKELNKFNKYNDSNDSMYLELIDRLKKTIERANQDIYQFPQIVTSEIVKKI